MLGFRCAINLLDLIIPCLGRKQVARACLATVSHQTTPKSTCIHIRVYMICIHISKQNEYLDISVSIYEAERCPVAFDLRCGCAPGDVLCVELMEGPGRVCQLVLGSRAGPPLVLTMTSEKHTILYICISVYHNVSYVKMCLFFSLFSPQPLSCCSSLKAKVCPLGGGPCVLNSGRAYFPTKVSKLQFGSIIWRIVFAGKCGCQSPWIEFPDQSKPLGQVDLIGGQFDLSMLRIQLW